MESLQTFGRGDAKSLCIGCKANVGIVLSEQNAIFCARGEHTIGFIYTFGDQIVDENANIGFIATECESFVAAARKCCVDAGYDALSTRFFVPRGSVHLSCKEESAHFLRFQRVMELCGREEIVFNGIAWAIDFHISETRHLFEGFNLHIHRQR